MNLKNNQITVGELLDNPAAKALFQARFPTVMRHPLIGASRMMTLEQLLSFAKAYLPQSVIADTLRTLQGL